MQKSLFSIHYTSIAAAFCLLIALAAGCTSDDSQLSDAGNANTGQTKEVVTQIPIKIALGGYGEEEQSDDDTRALPPGIGSTPGTTDDGYTESKSIDAVRVIAFRRRSTAKEDDENGQADSGDGLSPFEYDPRNDMTLTDFTDEDRTDAFYPSATHKHRVVKGQFGMSEGFEYRIVAIAYDSKEKWPYPQYDANQVVYDGMLNVKSGTTYDDFCAKFRDYLNPEKKNDSPNCWGHYLGHYLWPGIITEPTNAKCLTRRLTVIPQLFYGTIYAASDATKNPVIGYDKYIVDRTPQTTLTGTLYRGMAEVEVNIKSKHYSNFVNTEWYCLLADNVLTKTKLTSYDDFKKGSEPVEPWVPKKGDKGTYTAIACQKFVKEGDMVTLKAYLLPAKTRLAVRVIFNKDPWILNGQIKAKDVVSSESATGVIEVDALNDVFYLRRNHKYVFTYTDQGLLLDKSHRLD